MSDETYPSSYIMGILVFVLIIGSCVSMISMFRDYDSDFGMNESEYKQFNSTFYVLDDIDNTVEDLEQGVTDTNSTSFGVFGVLNSLISGGWQSLKLLTGSLSFMNSVFSGLTTYFGIPGFVVKIIGLIVTIFITFAIYSAIFQRKI